MESPTPAPETIAVMGDTHAHLQLALCMLARWQRDIGANFDAVFLCGDVGTFTEPAQLDNATRRHARSNPCELEFLQQWSAAPQAHWLDAIFAPTTSGGLGLTCPVVMVHGNHEGFEHLERLAPKKRPADDVPLTDLPTVDTAGRIRLLPTGWAARTRGGRRVAGVGGIQPGQRSARYHPMAFIDEAAVNSVLDAGPVDVLITHQGPASVQFDAGSELLEPLADAGVARFWFHGHATPTKQIASVGPGGRCQVVPLGDIAFAGRGNQANDPGLEGWSYVRLGEPELHVVREPPSFWREYRRGNWSQTSDGQLICPDLVDFV